MSLTLVIIIISCIIGCGGNDNDVEGPFTLDSITPDPGSEILENDIIHITFNRNPGVVTAYPGTVSGHGRSRQIVGPFDAGTLAITIEWTEGYGSPTFEFTVEYSVTPIEKTSVEE